MGWIVEWKPLNGGKKTEVGTDSNGKPVLPRFPCDRREWRCVAATASGTSRLYALGSGKRRAEERLYAYWAGPGPAPLNTNP